MGSSTASSLSLFISPDTESPSFLRRPRRRGSNLSFLTSPTAFLCYPRSSNSRTLRLSASLLHSNVDLSWSPPDPNSLPNDYGGWAVVQAPPNRSTKKKGLYFLFFSKMNIFLHIEKIWSNQKLVFVVVQDSLAFLLGV